METIQVRLHGDHMVTVPVLYIFGFYLVQPTIKNGKAMSKAECLEYNAKNRRKPKLLYYSIVLDTTYCLAAYDRYSIVAKCNNLRAAKKLCRWLNSLDSSLILDRDREYITTVLKPALIDKLHTFKGKKSYGHTEIRG